MITKFYYLLVIVSDIEYEQPLYLLVEGQLQPIQAPHAEK
jgi:hypothetical protein